MAKINNDTLETLLKNMIDAGLDMTQYRKSSTKLIVPAHMLQAAQTMFGDKEKQYLKEVDFDE